MWPRRTTRAPVFTGRSFCERQLGVRFILLAPQLTTTLFPRYKSNSARQNNTITNNPTNHPPCVTTYQIYYFFERLHPPIFLKGFTLPTSNTTSNGSFSNLITQTSANANTIVQTPLMFVRGGSVNPDGYLNHAGDGGYYWSSIGLSGRYAYSLNFSSGGVVPSYDYYRNLGLFIRCVALGG